MRNFSEKFVEKIKSPSLFTHNIYFHTENRVFMIWKKYIVEPCSPQITIRHLRHAWEIPKSPNTPSSNMQYIMLLHYNSGSTNVSHCYVTRALRVYFSKQIVRLACYCVFYYVVHNWNCFDAACKFGRLSPRVTCGQRGSRVCRWSLGAQLLWSLYSSILSNDVGKSNCTNDITQYL